MGRNPVALGIAERHPSGKDGRVNSGISILMEGSDPADNSSCLLGRIHGAVVLCHRRGTEYFADSRYSTLNLSGGFMHDPATVQVQAGGADSASPLGPGCAVFINNNAPDVRLNFQAGQLPLFIYAQSQADTTLVVNLHNGLWMCNDDSRVSTLVLRSSQPCQDSSISGSAPARRPPRRRPRCLSRSFPAGSGRIPVQGWSIRPQATDRGSLLEPLAQVLLSAWTHG